MKSKNYLWGIFFILGGLLIVVNQLGFFQHINMTYLIISILLVPIIIKSLLKKIFSGVFFPIAIIGIMYAKELSITNLVPWPILITALFLSIGFSLIFRKNWNIIHISDSDNPENFDEIINTEDSSIVKINVSFGSSIKYVNSTNFKKGIFNCTFGGLKIYFDNTILDENGARVHLNASFAGIELYIPKDWKVVFNTVTNLAGIEEKNKSIPDETKTLILTGDISFSGVEIIYI